MLPTSESLEAALFSERPLRLGRPAAQLRRLARYVYAITRDLATGDLNLRAVGLVFTSLLSTVPLFAFSFSVLKGLGIHHDLAPLLIEFFRPLGDRSAELTGRILTFVDHLKGGVIGSLGLAFLLWTALSVVQKIEDAFNHIWHVTRPRGLGRRLGEYVAILVVGPIVVATSLGLSAAASPLLGQIFGPAVAGWLSAGVTPFTPLVAGTFAFGFLYAYIPNTRVAPRAALGAAFAASVVWAAASHGFAVVMSYSTQMVAVYAGFSIVLAALLWLWLNWLILLTGALLAFYLEHPEYLRSGQRDVVASARLRDQLALAAMVAVARAFKDGVTIDARTLAQRFEVPSMALAPILDALESAGLIVTGGGERLLPGREPAAIALDHILLTLREAGAGRAILLRAAQTPTAIQATSAEVEAAIRRALGTRTLADLCEAAAGEAAG